MSSDDELFKLLEESKHIPGNDIERYIKDMEVIPSRTPTQNVIIYWIYLTWCDKNTKDPIPRNSFFKQFKKHFKQASRDRVRRYYATSTHFILHPRDVEAARSEARQERRWHALRRMGKLQSRTLNKSKEYWRLAVAKRWAHRKRDETKN